MKATATPTKRPIRALTPMSRPFLGADGISGMSARLLTSTRAGHELDVGQVLFEADFVGLKDAFLVRLLRHGFTVGLQVGDFIRADLFAKIFHRFFDDIDAGLGRLGVEGQGAANRRNQLRDLLSLAIELRMKGEYLRVIFPRNRSWPGRRGHSRFLRHSAFRVAMLGSSCPIAERVSMKS